MNPAQETCGVLERLVIAKTAHQQLVEGLLDVVVRLW
jgi:hypothetical protein